MAEVEYQHEYSVNQQSGLVLHNGVVHSVSHHMHDVQEPNRHRGEHMEPKHYHDDHHETKHLHDILHESRYLHDGLHKLHVTNLSRLAHDN